MKKYLSLIILICFFLLPNISLGTDITLNLKYPTMPGGFNLETHQNLNEIVAWFYYFIISIAGIAVFIMLVWGGFEWMTSAGSPARITSAKDRMTSALLGLLIILSSVLILQVINPELTFLNLPKLGP